MLTGALLVLLLGCGSAQQVQGWSDEFLEATREADAGNFDGAEARLNALAAEAPSLERRRQAQFELARSAQRQGRITDALALYEAVWNTDIKDSTGARALHEAARIHADKDLGASIRMHRQVIEDYPEAVASEFSLNELRRHFDRQKEPLAFLALLQAMQPAVEDTTVGRQILLLTGTYLDDHAGDEEGALEAYYAAHLSCTTCAAGDDGLWRMVLIFERRQSWRAALHFLEHLARRTEASWFIGTYNSPRASDARFKLGMIHLLFLEDQSAARRHFKQFLKDFPHSFDADDAAWHIVQSYRIEGDEKRYEAALGRFLNDYPESRFVRIATRGSR